MPARLLRIAAGLLTVLWPTVHAVVRGQEIASIHAPVTALHLEGQRLWIGQGPTLVEASITRDNLYPVAALDLRRHDIRAITVNLGITFVLSEDGLTTLDAQRRVLDFAEGGGQRISVQNDRVYVAALNAGVRLFKFDVSGRLTRLGLLRTTGPANDVAAERDNHLWVAEGVTGVRLYDVHNASAHSVLASFDDMAQATLLRRSGSRLYVGHANRLTVLDTSDQGMLLTLGSIGLDGPAPIADLLIQGSRAYIGRFYASGEDVLSLDISNPASMTLIDTFGSDGAGESLALNGDDLMIGSGRLGLRRVRFGQGRPVQIAAWQSPSQAAFCSPIIPTDPEPANLGTVPDGPVTLQWKMGCDPSAVQVQINGTPVALPDGFTYQFIPQSAMTTWQVTVLDATGHRTDGPRWTFESVIDGWLATPTHFPNGNLLYTAPAFLIDSRSPAFFGLLACIGVGIGLSGIVGAGWLLSGLTQRRNLRRQR